MIDLTENLKGKTAAITGAGGILCGGMAKELAKYGINVAVIDLDLEAAQKIADEIKAAGGNAAAIACNVLETASVQEAETKARKQFGPIDILINGAGGNNPKASTTGEIYSEAEAADPNARSFFDLDPAGVGFVFNLNFLGTFIPSQVFAKHMVNRSTTIINVSSMSAFSPMTKVMAYSAAKAGVSNFTEWMAVHFAQAGIRVNAIAPGFFETAQNAKLLRHDDGTLTARSEKIISHTPQRRFGEPEDLYGTLLWLIDENMSRFVTGVTVPIDGGFNAYSGV